MKRILFLCTLTLCNLAITAQENGNNNPKEEKTTSTSKAIEFSNSNGTLITKDFYDLPKVKSVECQVLIMTDVVKTEKIGCLRLITYHKSSYSKDTYIGTLDYEELDACIQSLTYIKEQLLPSNPTVYTETEFRTSDGVELGAYYSKGKWTAYVHTKGYTRYSAEYFNSSNIEDLISVMVQAKTMIEEKTK